MCSRNLNSCLRDSEAPQRCPITVGNSTCGEANSLDIMKEFNRLYEERMEQVDSDAGGDCLQEKVKLQSEWIKNLIQQNEMLVKAVQELEFEATERVQHLEQKLQKSAESLSEVMKKYREHDYAADLLEEPLQKISHLEDDIKNVLEFIRRIREGGQWDADDLFFYNITRDELLGPKCKCYQKNQFNFPDQAEVNEGEKMLNEKDRTVHELTQKVNYYNSFGDVEALAKELSSRRIECETLKQEMVDMRQALTEEVASKYDQIILLRKDVQVLEDRCLQADKQTAFKEDIIRELRREIKQLKQQAQKLNKLGELEEHIRIKDNLLLEQLELIKTLVVRIFNVDKGLKELEERTLSVTSFQSDHEKCGLQCKIDKLTLENTTLKETLNIDKTHVEELDAQFKSFLQERDELKKKLKAADKKAKKEKESLLCECNVLKEEIRQLKERNAHLQKQVESSKKSLHDITCQSEGCKEKMEKVMDDNRKTLEQIISLNEENRNLSQSIDVLRHRSEYTNSFTHDEISKLNLTIDHLRDNLEKTRLMQEDEEKAHENEICMLQCTIDNLEHNINNLKEKYERDSKTCKICRGRSKVGFLETTEVQADIQSKESEILKGELDQKNNEIQSLQKKVTELEDAAKSHKSVASEIQSKVKLEIDKKNSEIQSLKTKITTLEVALSAIQEQSAELQEAAVNDLKSNIKSEIEKKNSEIKSLKNKIISLEVELKTVQEQAANLHEAAFKDLKSNVKLEIDRKNFEIQSLKNNIATLDAELRTAQQTANLQEAAFNDLKSNVKLEIDKKNFEIQSLKSKITTLEVELNTVEEQSVVLREAVSNDLKSKMKLEIDKKNHEIRSLKSKVTELESALSTCEERATNLQEAVTLYSNSVNVLESSDKKAKCQIDQQKTTIANLQEALVAVKQELDDLRKKSQENGVKGQQMLTHLEDLLKELEDESDFVKEQADLKSRELEILQDFNFNLEVEHCDSLQDVEALEEQLIKYKNLIKIKEDQTKKLEKQKKCYEDIIGYFKNEMAVMAEQLNNLQELLTLSNTSAQQESSKIMQAFFEVQTINEKLSDQLCACEQKVQLENQMNQIHEAKICELQQLVSEKEINLSKHDETILNIRKTLNDSLKQNENLQQTIVDLNETINGLQDAIKTYEYENCASKRSCLEFQHQIGTYCCKLEDVKKDLEEKTAECLKLEMAYNNEKRALKAAQKQLQEIERAQQENQRELVSSVEEMRQKLQHGEESIKKLCCECENLQAQLGNLSRKEAVKDLEIKRYRKIVSDLKTTMMELNTELNKNMTHKEIRTSCKNSNCRKNFDKDEKPQDICLSCPCEVEFYQKMVDMLKKSVSELKHKLSDTQEANQDLEEKLRKKSAQLAEALRAKEELERKLSFGQKCDMRICELECENDRLKQELHMKSLQLTDMNRSANEINDSKCMQLSCAQEEIINLKNDVTSILNRQYSLKRENEELQAQMAELNCNNNCLNEKNKMLKEQLDQNLMRIKNLNAEKETLLRKNKDLMSELRSIQSMTCSSDKHHRLTSESLKQLEADIEDLKTNKEDICFESKNMIKHVRAWVSEQKKINSFVAKREQEYINAIKGKNKENVPCPIQRPPSRISKNNVGACSKMCTSPCSLGSQGIASFYDDESPSPSPDLGLSNEWYSTTFRAESDDNESEEDYCVNTLENLTQQMKKSNKFWKSENCRSRKDCRVTKDVKK